MPTASILLRLSKQAGDTNLSLEGMESDCRRLCDSHGLDVYAVHVDDGISGAVRDRPGFVAWLEDGRSGAVDALVSWSGDRLTREGVNAAALVLDVVEGKDSTSGRVTRRPVRFLSADDGLDSEGDPTAFRFSFVIKAEVARAERDRIVARNQAAARRLREQVGRHRGGMAPYGYRTAPRKAGGLTLVPDPDEARIVREIVRRVLAGESLWAVVHDLNAREVPTRFTRSGSAKPKKSKRGRLWTIQTLRGILTGPAAGGYVRHKGLVLTGEDGRPARWYEPILDDDTRAQLRAIVRQPSQKRHEGDARATPAPGAGRVAKVTRLLSGLVVADCCGGPMYAHKPSPSKPAPIYRHAPSGKCARQTGIRAEPLEEYVSAEFLRRFGGLAELRPVRVANARADLAAINLDIDDTAAAMREQGADIVKLAARLTELHEQREALAALPETEETRYEPTGRSLGDAWHAGTFQTRNALMADVLTGPIVVSAVGHARKVKTLDLDRVSIPWRGNDPTSPDYLAGEE